MFFKGYKRKLMKKKIKRSWVKNINLLQSGRNIENLGLVFNKLIFNSVYNVSLILMSKLINHLAVYNIVDFIYILFAFLSNLFIDLKNVANIESYENDFTVAKKRNFMSGFLGKVKGYR